MLEEKMFAFAMLGSEWVLWLLVLLSILPVSPWYRAHIVFTTKTVPAGQIAACTVWFP